jgi:hypothetical protein
MSSVTIRSKYDLIFMLMCLRLGHLDWQFPKLQQYCGTVNPMIRSGHADRLIAGVNFLGELSPKLRQSVLLIPEKIAAKATYEDAETLAKFAGLRPDYFRDDNDYNRYPDRAMGVSEM